MIRAVIFDLDNTLAASNEPGEQLFEPAFRAIREANRGTLTEARLSEAFAEMWFTAYDEVAEKYGFSKAMHDAGWDAFVRIEVTAPMKGYDDLHLLDTMAVEKYLVTSGFRRLQESKIRALGFADKFAEVIVDAIDEPDPKGKEAIFRELASRRGLAPEEVLVAGDNPVSEIEAGRNLGMVTVQTVRPRVKRGEGAEHYVSGLAEIAAMLERP